MDRVSRLDQVKIYTGKCFRIFINEKGWKSFVSAAIITVFIVLVLDKDLMFSSLQATQSGAFALVCGCIWIGIFNSIQSICRERAIIKREYRTGLHISSYVAAHMIYEMAISFIEALIVTVILFIFSAGGPDSSLIAGGFIDLLITFFLIILSADILAMIVSCIVKNETAAMTVMPFVLIFQLVMSGIIFILSDVMDKVANLTISKWGVRAVCAISDLIKPARELLPKDAAMLAERPELSDAYNHDPGYLLKIWGILALFIIVYGIICTIALKFVDKDKR